MYPSPVATSCAATHRVASPIRHHVGVGARTRILFVAEDITLAHVGRMIALASSLDALHYDVAVACSNRFACFIHAAGLSHEYLRTIDSDHCAERLAAGKPMHTEPVLRDAIRNDLELLGRTQPDLLVSDFRVSLGLSAELAGIRHIALVNGYWSPNSTLDFPVPEIPLTRLFGVRLLRAAQPLVLPTALRSHVRAFNRVCKDLKLEPATNLFSMYTRADEVLYADLPDLAPVSSLPQSHSFLGPVLWQPETQPPQWWNHVPMDRPIVYVNAGSSGCRDILATVVEALENEPVVVIAATAGIELTRPLPTNVFAAPYLPGIDAVRRSTLVVCNGGSGTIYQALSAGVPILGIPSNADQYLAMDRVAELGAGRIIRAGQLNATRVAEAVSALSCNPNASNAARRLATKVEGMNGQRRFADLIASRANHRIAAAS